MFPFRMTVRVPDGMQKPSAFSHRFSGLKLSPDGQAVTVGPSVVEPGQAWAVGCVVPLHGPSPVPLAPFSASKGPLHTSLTAGSLKFWELIVTASLPVIDVQGSK